jgi:V8-like Glu-specific endopeptidase
MTFLSPRAQKAIENAQGGYNARNAFHDKGPHLNADGTYVIVPSVEYNAALVAKLKANGFLFEGGEYPQWQRYVGYAAPDGKMYSAEQWLKSAQKLYAEVWEDWEPTKEEA